MTIKQLFQWIDKEVTPEFRQKHKREIEDLVCYYLNFNWSDLILKREHKITIEKTNEIKGSLKQLVSGRPLAYIASEKYFYKSLFKVTEAVLIPRAETEKLVDLSFGYMPSQEGVIIDLGTGSGCIGLSIAKERPENFVYLIDASKKAIDIAMENSQILALKNCSFDCSEVGVESRGWPELKENVDLIVSNPPYIEKGDSRVESRVRDHEPHQALYAPEKGLYWIHKFLLWGYDYLKTNGFFIFEFGQNQEGEILKILKTMKYQVIDIVEDNCGIKRFFILKK